MKNLLLTLVFACFVAVSAYCTDVTVSASQQPNSNLQNIGSSLTLTVNTSGTAVSRVSGSAIPQSWVDRNYSGYIIQIASVNYYVASTDSTSQLTITATAGTQTSVSATIFPFVLLRAYATASFTPLGASYVVQAGAPGSAQFAKQVAVSQIGGTLYYPSFVLPASVDSQDNQSARYTFGLYRQDGSFIQFYQCYGGSSLRLSTTTPTSLPGICSYNSPGATIERTQFQNVYTQSQTLTRQEIYALGTGSLITGTAQRAQGIRSGGTGLEDTPISYTTTSATVLGTLAANGYVQPGTGTEAAIAATTGAAGALRKATDGARGLMVHNGTFWYNALGYANAQDFGCKADGVADSGNNWISGTDNAACFTAINTWVNAQATTDTGLKVYFPPGRYGTSVPLAFTRRATVEGAGSGMWGGSTWGATEIWTNTGQHGITLTQPADFSVIRNIVFKSKNNNAAANSDNGVQVNAHGIVLENVGVEGYGNDGISIDSTRGYNCNNFQLRQVVVRHNYRHGVYVNGSDTQAGVIWGGDISVNGKYGVYLDTFGASVRLTSTHAESNGLKWTGGVAHPNYGNSDYYINSASPILEYLYSDGSKWIVFGSNASYYWFTNLYNGAPVPKWSADGGDTVTTFSSGGSSNVNGIMWQHQGMLGKFELYDPRGWDSGRQLIAQNDGTSGNINLYTLAGAGGDTRQFFTFQHSNPAGTKLTNWAVQAYADINPTSNGGAKINIGGDIVAGYGFAGGFFDLTHTKRTRYYGSSSGTLDVIPPAASLNGTLTLPNTATTDTIVGNATAATLTNKTISGAANTLTNIGNSSLTNSSVTIGSTAVSLGGTAATVAGLTLTTPTIASFTNATHDHTNAAGGGQLAEGALNLSDNTTNNVSASKHGLAPKAPNDAAQFLDGTGAYSKPVFSAVSGSLGGGALAAGACASTTVTVTGATTSMAAVASPTTDPGDAYYVRAYVSAADTVTLKVCSVLGGTPTASTYQVRVLK